VNASLSFRPMRAHPLHAACLAVALVCGCGGGDGGEEPRAARAQLPVALDVSVPSDEAVVRAEVIDVRGSVDPPGARVRVLGEPAHVRGGSFAAAVPLLPGANVIDVIATARGREPAMTALRVVREMPVEVPDLEDAEISEAQERVADAGLQLEVHESGGLFDDLFGGELAVCEQDPEAGELVRRGTTIVVAVARSC
jgi:glucodextranase-like protein/PASTA domain-containing protein